MSSRPFVPGSDHGVSARSVAARGGAAPAALSAFLRGIERRGAVLAELQAGDAQAGDVALSAAMRQFRAGASAAAMSEWPGRFWAALLAQPQLRQRAPIALPLDATDRLADIGSGPRAALLLRLAAGLSEVDAARALGIARPTYRMALQRALPRHADGRADPQAWQRLRETIHRRIKTLPPERLARLSGAREDLLHGAAQGPRDDTRAPTQPPTSVRPRWLLPLLWGLLAVCALAFVGSFWWSPVPHYRGVAAGHVRVAPLPDAAPPASRYGEVAGLLSHRDFELLADPQGVAQSRGLAFYSWMVAQGEVPAEPAGGAAPPTAGEAHDGSG